MSLPTVAELRFRPDGVAAVDAALRLTRPGRTWTAMPTRTARRSCR